MIKSMNVIQVSEELSEQWKTKNVRWMSLTNSEEDSNKVFYENLAWYKKNIEKKYLPEEIVCHYGFHFDDKEQLMKGIEMALWDCDLSHYKIEDVVEREYFNKLTLKYSE